MPKIIQDNQIIDDLRTLVSDKETTDLKVITNTDAILPYAAWKYYQDQLPNTSLNIWLDSDESADLLADDLSKFSLIAINFPAFTDGRGYSTAFKLREHYGYSGKLMAIGDVLIDQLTAMRRVGFDCFALREDQDINQALNHFHDFKQPYQASVDPKMPLFRQ